MPAGELKGLSAVAAAQPSVSQQLGLSHAAALGVKCLRQQKCHPRWKCARSSKFRPLSPFLSLRNHAAHGHNAAGQVLRQKGKSGLPSSRDDRGRGRRSTVVASASGGAETKAAVATAEGAIVEGLALYKKGKVREALAMFGAAMDRNPTKEEAQAALYNKACCHAYREEGAEAQKALREALGKYELAFSVILSDPDMAPFRALPEFVELQNEARKGGAEIGSGFRRDLKLINEVRSPFRGVRRFIYIALGAAAGISTFFTIPRLLLAFQSGEGAPELLATLGNLGVNVGGGAVFVALYLWEQRKEEEQIAKVQRDETLSRLPVRLSTNRVVELSQLRETTRPVILVGTRAAVEKSLKQAERFRADLLERGVLLVPLVWGEGATAAQQLPASQLAPKKGFGAGTKKAPAVAPAPVLGRPQDSEAATVDEFEARAREVAAKRVVEVEKKFKAEAVSPLEWQQWVRQQQEAEGVQPGEDVFLLLRLDGRLRRSGRGMPVWLDVVRDLPPLDSIVSKLER